jgi:hypothetical protein
MNKITGLLASKRIISSIILLGGVLLFTYSIQENSQKLKRVTNLESGIQTCFSRVSQTYTAKLLNEQTSQYLSQNFQSLTEECFAEGVLNVEENLKSDLPIIAKKLSTLASNVHWFHEDSLLPINSAGALSTATEGKSIGSRFETIETTKDEVLDVAEQFKSSISNVLNRDKNFFYVTSALLVLMLVLEYMANANRKISNSARENEAAEELSDRDGIESVKVGEIIRVALEQNDLNNCAKLFYNSYSHKSGTANLKLHNKEVQVLENLITPEHLVRTAVKAKVQEQIEQVWNDDKVGNLIDRPTEVIEEFNLNQVSARAIDLLADKIFSLGVQLKVVIAEQITIKGKEEELEQIFYHLFAGAISLSEDSPISMFAQRLGDIVILDLIFQSEDANKFTSTVDMQICQTLLDEINAKVKIDNTLDQLGNVNGIRVKVIFIAGQDLRSTHQAVYSELSGRDLIS